ncbi:MAG: M1 family aminopeptidase [Bacteroidota bacterium]
MHLRFLYTFTILTLIFSFVFAFARQENYYSCRHKAWHGSKPCHAYDTQEANSRSDTIDILNYTINLDITDFTNEVIKGNCEITFVPKMNNINSISLDLLKLNIDSIKVDNQSASFSYDDTLIVTMLPGIMNIGDTASVKVYYEGTPQIDTSTYGGGFYFSGGYAYNIGVGFEVNPHNFGRAWFPCFDNFVERSTHEFFITTEDSKNAFCNGLLQDTVHNPNSTIIWHWKMDQTIPSYLASVAVAGYATVNISYNGINGPIPIMLNALPSDTTKLKNSFLHLTDAIGVYETYYGPHQFDRIGYNLVPVVGGAMEHATNIAYHRSFADGSLWAEDIMAHELSHHWWGDMVTCETAEDMWLNEGFAVYSEFLFWEDVYDKDTYLQEVRRNHEKVLHLAHITENGYRAISGIPHEYTYGDHVYDKGGDVVHTLRGYLGDSLFFSGLTTFLANNQFTHINSYDLRNQLSSITGIDLTDFFNNWVFNPGFPHFSINSTQITPNGIYYDVTVYVKQKLTGAPSYYNNVPLEITFMDTSWNEQTETIIMSGATSSFTFTLPFSPVFTALNMNSKISDAISSEAKVIDTTWIDNFSHARFKITVNAITDSAFIRVEHNWTAPDPIVTNTIYKLSPNRYWKIDGILPNNFSASAEIVYDGRESGSSYFDHLLIADSLTEDSMVLLYRMNTSENWHEYEYYTKISGNSYDKFGVIIIDSLVLGEYVFAMKGDTIYSAIPETEAPASWRSAPVYAVYPNPASDSFVVKTTSIAGFVNGSVLKVVDVNGRIVCEKFLQNNKLHSREFEIKTKGWEEGIYIVSIGDSRGVLFQKKIVVLR